jgi:uncharacterized protein YoxC
MNNEEFDRRMESFLEQQARFAEDLERQKARQAETTQQIRELAASLGTLRDAVLALTYHVERHDQQIAANEKAIAEQAQRGRETDARLDRLALIVERHISGHQQ